MYKDKGEEIWKRAEKERKIDKVVFGCGEPLSRNGNWSNHNDLDVGM